MNNYFLFLVLLTPEAIPLVSSLLVSAGFEVGPGFGDGTIPAPNDTPWRGTTALWRVRSAEDIRPASQAVCAAIDGKVSYLGYSFSSGGGIVGGANLVPPNLAPPTPATTAYDLL